MEMLFNRDMLFLVPRPLSITGSPPSLTPVASGTP